jgi:hypothetical protein
MIAVTMSIFYLNMVQDREKPLAYAREALMAAMPFVKLVPVAPEACGERIVGGRGLETRQRGFYSGNSGIATVTIYHLSNSTRIDLSFWASWISALLSIDFWSTPHSLALIKCYLINSCITLSGGFYDIIYSASLGCGSKA